MQPDPRTPAPALSAEEAEIVARFDAAPVPAELVVERCKLQAREWCEANGEDYDQPVHAAPSPSDEP